MEELLKLLNEIIGTMDAGDYIAVISCVISVIAAIISFVSFRLAKKEYKLQLKLYSEGLANYNFKVIEACLKDDNKSDTLQYWINILVTNVSDKQTSIVKYELRLECLNGLTFKPEYLLNYVKNEDVKYLELPQNIESHNSVRGWCVFSIPRDTYNTLAIERTGLCMKDIHGKSEEQNIIYIKEELIDYEIEK